MLRKSLATALYIVSEIARVAWTIHKGSERRGGDRVRRLRFRSERPEAYARQAASPSV
jgi:hypothetical protein